MITRAVGVYFATVLVLGSGVGGCDAACHLALASIAILPGLGYVYEKAGALPGAHRPIFWGSVFYLVACAPLWFLISFWVPNSLSGGPASDKSFIEHLALYLGCTGLWVLGVSDMCDRIIERRA